MKSTTRIEVIQKTVQESEMFVTILRFQNLGEKKQHTSISRVSFLDFFQERQISTTRDGKFACFKSCSVC